MNDTVELLVREQYGQQTFHPHNDTAHLLAAIAGTKTITKQTIGYILKLGYEVVYKHPEVCIK